MLVLLINKLRDRLLSKKRDGLIVSKPNNHQVEQFYQALEEHFRGSESGIYERMQDAYKYMQATLPPIAPPVLDIGCGRGEWLAVLREQGLQARGIDMNKLMVERCREKGLDAHYSDMFDYLQGMNDDTFGFISAFHVIEHIPVESLLVLLPELLRVLKPEGQVWLETPNPENMLVATHRFYLDPTHNRPLPPDLMVFMLEYAGFQQVQVHRLQPWPLEFHIPDNSVVSQRMNQMFYGSQDYAVTGIKPS